MIKTLFLKAFLLLLSHIVFCQDKQDTVFVQRSIQQAENLYHQSIAKQLNLYNGRDYKPYIPYGEEHPYFLKDDWTIGSIIYEADHYASIPLLFDLRSEKLLTENPFNGSMMELASSKVQQFEINGHTFVRLKQDKNLSEVTEGFYELLYNGNLKLYARRKKNFQERPKGNIMQAEFDEKNKYFLFNGKAYVKVSNKSSLIKALGGKKKLSEVANRKSKTYSSNKTEDTLVYLTERYDTHTPSL
ncbi:MAG: hypothetical protein JNM57_03165 [Cyclobacteriaceae bacterium]|nr:hypothetical protein [Cyclobacteriaceae bacterium]